MLIVGCGDVGLRAVPLLARRAAAPRVIALTSSPERKAELRAAGTTPLAGNLDDRASLARLGGLSAIVLHLAPPQKSGDEDLRTRALIAALNAPVRRVARSPSAAVARQRKWRGWFRATFESRVKTKKKRGKNHRAGTGKSRPIVPEGLRYAPRARPAARSPRIVYASTSGVYGDCGGASIDETRRVRPANARAKRRVSAEKQLRRATRHGALDATIVRIPGIYAANRLPVARLRKGTPALLPEDDVFTNHIHADDLAAILVRAIVRGKPQRIVHASDDSSLRMGEYFDLVADAYGLPRPPRVSRAEAQAQLEPMMLSFMGESRRLRNERLTRELGYVLRFPTIEDFLRAENPGTAFR